MIEFHSFADGNPDERATQAAIAAEQAGDWLWEVRPLTARNFANRDVAAESMRRVNESEHLEGYVITIDDKLIGVATVIKNLRIWNPTRSLHILGGREIDYWTHEAVGRDDHIQIARSLLERDGYAGRALGILTERESERASGIVDTMSKVGGLGRVAVPSIFPDFGLPYVGEPLQVYATQVDRA